MDNENIFFKHKILISSFFLLFLLFIFFHFKYSLGMYFDIPAMFISKFNHYYDGFSGYMLFTENRVRFFSSLLASLPYNIVLNTIHHISLKDALSFFSASYFIVHLFALLINFLIAARTKRFDIAAIAFAFYTFFCIQNAIWACREVHIAVLFYFAVLSYFLSKEKLGVGIGGFFKDTIPLILLILYLFESFEITILFGLILFIFSILYLLKDFNEPNIGYKIFIGISGLLISLYIAAKMYYFSFGEFFSVNQGINEYLQAFKFTFENLLSSNSLIVIFGLIMFAYIFRLKKEISKPVLIVSTAVFILILGFLTHFMSKPMMELQNYTFVFIFIYPVVLVILILNYFDKEINNIFLSNLIVIASIVGIIGLSWQIHTCFEFEQYVEYLKKILTKPGNELYVSIPEEDFNKYNFLKFNTCFGTVHKSIVLSDEYKIRPLLIPEKYFPDYTDYCYDIKQNDYNYYDSEDGYIFLQGTIIKVKNDVWDLSDVKDDFVKDGKIKLIETK